MFTAKLLSLSDGQSYPNVKIFEDTDIDERGISRIFENWTACFICDNSLYIAHHWKIRVIKISHERLSPGPDSIRADRLILDGDIIYPNVSIMHSDHYADYNIPYFFVKRDGIAGQMVFMCDEGTFLTHDTNVVSIIIDSTQYRGVTRSYNKTYDQTRCTQHCKIIR